MIDAEKGRTPDSFSTGLVSDQSRYLAKTREELIEFFDEQREELDEATMLNLLAATEAALRVDYLVRVIRKKRDKISKVVGKLHKKHEKKVPLSGILNCWKQDAMPATNAVIGRFSGALHLRHWLAHGRCWRPKLGQKYDPRDVFEICDALLKATASS